MHEKVPLWLKRLPNQLTFFRAASTPLIIIFMLQGKMAEVILQKHLFPSLYDLTAGLLFSLSAFTDFFDGWIARKYKIESVIGKLLDPVADKVLTVSCLIILVEKHRLAGWAVVLLIIRDLGITSLRLKALEEGVVLGSYFTARLKTVFLGIGIGGLIFYGKIYSWFSFRWIGLIALVIAFFLSFQSAFLYLRDYYRILTEKYPPKNNP